MKIILLMIFFAFASSGLSKSKHTKLSTDMLKDHIGIHKADMEWWFHSGVVYSKEGQKFYALKFMFFSTTARLGVVKSRINQLHFALIDSATGEKVHELLLDLKNHPLSIGSKVEPNSFNFKINGPFNKNKVQYFIKDGQHNIALKTRRLIINVQYRPSRPTYF